MVLANIRVVVFRNIFTDEHMQNLPAKPRQISVKIRLSLKSNIYGIQYV